MENITSEDLELINDLSSRSYSGLSMSSNSTEEERIQFKAIKNKLKGIANFFADKYNLEYGPFKTNVSPEANPMTRGNTLNHTWSTLFKGSTNKQYAAQISFVMHKKEPYLDVGFYFGRSSAHSLDDKQRAEFESQLSNLGNSLSDTLVNNKEFQMKYHSLFDVGFTAYSNNDKLKPDEWISAIQQSPENSQIVAKVYSNDFGVIEKSTLGFYVSQIAFLMSAISDTNSKSVPIIKPLTPGESAKKAERLAEIGNKGESFIMANERSKLETLGFENSDYPKHVALESTAYGYDIISLNDNKEEIFIEVKTTTRSIEDRGSKQFFMSSHEHKVYKLNKSKYRLYRVYDVENTPSFEEIDLKNIEREADGYICKY